MALLRLALVSTLMLAACAAEPSTPASDVGALDAARDAGADVRVPDASNDLADRADLADLADLAHPGDVGESSTQWLRFTLNDGSGVDGELVATYDTARWWNPLDGLLYAVFDPAGYAPYPGDRSMRFIEAVDVASITPVDRPAGPTYREFLRQGGIYFERPPFADAAYVITGHDGYHLEEDGYGDFAWDFEVTDPSGRRFTGTGLANEDYLVWRQPVLSGVRGEVIEVVGDAPDNLPGSHPDVGVAVNNLVGIALGGSYYAYYLHFGENGIEPGVVVGSQVEVGDVLGTAGNSGVSLEPHTHVVLLWYDVDAGRSYAIPSEFRDVEVASTPRGPFGVAPWATPATGQWVREH